MVVRKREDGFDQAMEPRHQQINSFMLQMEKLSMTWKVLTREVTLNDGLDEFLKRFYDLVWYGQTIEEMALIRAIQNMSVTTLQAVFRGYQVRKNHPIAQESRTRRQRTYAAKSIQVMWKYHVWRMSRKGIFIRKKDQAAAAISRSWRIYKRRTREYYLGLLRLHLAKSIQRLWRSYVQRRRKAKQVMTEHIQPIGPASKHKSRRDAQETRKIQRLMIDHVQTIGMNYLEKTFLIQGALLEYRQRNCAALVIQCAWMYFTHARRKARITEEWRTLQHNAVVAMQCTNIPWYSDKLSADIRVVYRESKLNAQRDLGKLANLARGLPLKISTAELTSPSIEAKKTPRAA